MRSRPLPLLILALLLLAAVRLAAAQPATTAQAPMPTPAAPTMPLPEEQSPPVAPVVEGRGIWIEMKTLPADPDGIKKVVRQLARCNFNFLLVEVTYEGATLYPGPYQDARFKGLDPLRIVVDEAHKNKLEVHAWVWSLKQARWRAEDPAPGGPLLAQHPDWAAINATGQKVSPGSSYYWLCPSRAESRGYVISQLETLAREYPIDGVHLDYIRYDKTMVKGAPPPYCFCDHCRAEFQRAGGPDPVKIAPYTAEFRRWYQWRENLVSSLVAEISARVKAVRSSVVISAAVYPDPLEARRYFSQDWRLWVANGWLDFVAPMLYRDQTDTFTRRVQRYVKDGIPSQGVLLPGVGVNEILNRIFSHDVLIEQVMAARNQGMLGNVLFSFSVMNPYLEQFLINKVYVQPARVPFRDERGAVERLTQQARDILARQGDTKEANWLYARALDLAAILQYRANLGNLAASECPMPVAARFQTVPRVHITTVGAAPKIDGSLSDAMWKDVPELKLALNENGAWADARTWAKVASDGTNIYVAFHCEDGDMVRTLARTHAEIRHPWLEDHVGVFLDPGPSRSQYLVLRLDPIGRQALEKIPDGKKRPSGVGTPESAPDVLHWDGKIKHGEKFWNAEYSIPIAELMALHPGDREFGLNLIRVHRSGDRLHHDEWITTYGSPYDPLRFAVAELR